VDWTAYKRKCDEPDVFSRWMLQRTAELLAPEPVAAKLLAAVAGVRVAKPADHRGGPETDMFVLSLETEECELIVEVLEAMRADGWRWADGRGLGGFVEAWQEYRRTRPD